jgi:hypothetical protein
MISRELEQACKATSDRARQRRLLKGEVEPGLFH